MLLHHRFLPVQFEIQWRTYNAGAGDVSRIQQKKVPRSLSIYRETSSVRQKSFRAHIFAVLEISHLMTSKLRKGTDLFKNFVIHWYARGRERKYYYS